MTRLRLPAVLSAMILLGACAPSAPPTAAPDGGPGTADNPLVMSFVPSVEQEGIVTGGEVLDRLLEAETGLTIETNVATSYAAVVEAMGAGNAHIGWLNTFSYLLAHEKFAVEPLLVAERFGSTSYAGQILVGADTGIASIADLAGKKFCRPDALSTSGWIIPSITMKAAGVDEADLAEVIDVTSHDAVVAAILNGDCDAGATFVDARSDAEADHPDVKERVVVIATSDEIPNDNVSVIASLSPELEAAIRDGLLAVAADAEGLEALRTVYGIEGLAPVEDTFYDDFRATLNAAGTDIEDLAREP